MSSPIQPLQKTIIEPASGWRLVNFQELWQARELLAFMAWRDIKVRYKQTALGAVWAILQPALMMLVFTILFNKLAKLDTGDIPYPLFVCCGLLPWTYFSSAMSNAANSVIGSERLITKIYFPRLIVPYSAAISAAVDFAIAMVLLLGTMVWYQVAPSWQLIWMPLVFLLLTMTALGIGTGLAALNVAYRDFRYVLPFLLQFGMFVTPAIFLNPRTETEGWGQTLIRINPLNTLIESFRSAVLGTEMPWFALGWTSLLVLGIFLLGNLYFRRVEDQFADII